MPDVPEHLLWPLEPFAQSFATHRQRGIDVLAGASVAFVGLARNCAVRLAQNLGSLEVLAMACGSWKLHIESNDCEDATLNVLQEFATAHPQATYHYQDLGRGHYPAEFAGRRTIALAEYRDNCQRWVRDCAAGSDFVAVVDWDMQGGWSHHGFLNAIGWLDAMPDAYGMASASIFQYDHGGGAQWLHYDIWALRGIGQARCYWDTYTGGCGGWGFLWFPPVGSPPVLVSSAFGGLAIYRTADYLRGTYDGTQDCEHVAFHKSIAAATGKSMYLCPSMRTLMAWMEQPDAGHSLNSVQDVPSHA